MPSLYLSGVSPLLESTGATGAPSRFLNQEDQGKKSWPEGFPVYTKHTYILELFKEDAAEPEDSVTLTYVSSVQMQQPHALDRQWTLSKVYEQSTGFRERTFSISGRTGDQPLDISRFLKMRNFIEDYAEKKRSTENAFNNSATYRLILRMAWELESYEVSLITFSYQRESGNTTNSYIWNMVFASNNNNVATKRVLIGDSTVKDAVEKQLDSTLSEEPPKDETEVKRSVSTFTYNAETGDLLMVDGIRRSERFMERHGSQDTGDYLHRIVTRESTKTLSAEGDAAPPSTLKDVANDRTLKKAIDVVKPPPKSSKVTTSWFDDLTAAAYVFDEQILNAADKLVSMRLEDASAYRRFVTPNIAKISAFSYAVGALAGAAVATLPNLKRSVLSTRDDVVAAFQSLKESWRDLESLTSRDYWEKLAGDGWRNRRSTVSILINNINKNVIAHPAPSGNSGGGGTGLQDAYNLAWTFLGDRSRWSEIVEVNRMQDPYTKQDGTPLKVGDLVLIPDEQKGSPATITTSSLFGSDLMVEDGDLVMRGSGGLQIVSGEDNLRQSLSHRLKTVRGGNRAFPNFGLRKFLSEKQTSTLVAQVWSEIQAQVTADRRVDTVLKIVIDEQPAAYKTWLSIRLISQSNLATQFEYTPEI